MATLFQGSLPLFVKADGVLASSYIPINMVGRGIVVSDYIPLVIPYFGSGVGSISKSIPVVINGAYATISGSIPIFVSGPYSIECPGNWEDTESNWDTTTPNWDCVSGDEIFATISSSVPIFLAGYPIAFKSSYLPVFIKTPFASYLPIHMFGPGVSVISSKPVYISGVYGISGSMLLCIPNAAGHVEDSRHIYINGF